MYIPHAGMLCEHQQTKQKDVRKGGKENLQSQQGVLALEVSLICRIYLRILPVLKQEYLKVKNLSCYDSAWSHKNQRFIF